LSSALRPAAAGLRKAPRQGRLDLAHAFAVERAQALLHQIGRRHGTHTPREQRHLAAVTRMPDHQRAVLLEEHGLGQFADPGTPEIDAGHAEIDDAALGNRRFGQRRQHGCRHMRGRAAAVGSATLDQRHAGARAHELPGGQPPGQAGTEDGDIEGLYCCHEIVCRRHEKGMCRPASGWVNTAAPRGRRARDSGATGTADTCRRGHKGRTRLHVGEIAAYE
jgi:hypothetical protein